jgi:OPA family sugar phosphate sensor protein UhpC-like MFS transporter
MLEAIAEFFVTGKNKPVTGDQNAVKKMFDSRRRSVFLSITLGYALFYVLRLNFSVVKKPLLSSGVLDANQIGMMGALFFATYGIGKCLNSFLADRMNIKRFFSFGLFMSAAVTLAMGFTTSFSLLFALWGINGWFQSYGAGPCIVALNQWYSNRERGTFYGIWFASHNIGAALTYLITAALVMHYSWRMGFLVPGIMCIIGSLLIYRFMYDRPQVYGLPSVAEYKQDHMEEVKGEKKSVGSLQWEVVKRPAVWILGLSSCCCYIARYAIESWGIVFLTEVKGYTTLGASGLLSTMQIAGIFGTVLCGLVSDRLFNHKRNMPCLIFGILYAAAVAAFVYTPAQYDWVNWVSMCVYGFTMGALVCYLGGLMAVDICPKRATGAAMGMIGLLSYGGASLQEKVSGYLINAHKTIVNGKTVYDFSAAADFWVAAAVLSFILAALVWNAKVKEE